MMDYKEIFQEYYDEAIEELGMNEKDAGNYANDMLYDHYAGMADMYREMEKYDGI